MATRISRSFFKAEEALFVGYSRKTEPFCAGVKAAFEEAGTTVYAVNPAGRVGAVETYASIEAVPARPELAYVLTNKERSARMVEALAAKGVKRVAFQSKMSADPATLARCAELGMEAVVACPMMALGGGFHRFHGWLSGVRA